MPISLTELKTATKKGSLYNGKLNFEFKLHGADIDRIAEFAHLGEEDTDESIQEALTEFCRNVVKWDLLLDDDTPLPLTPEAIRDQKVPWSVITDIMMYVAEHRSPERRGGKSSRRSS